jgi:hypothetical protein
MVSLCNFEKKWGLIVILENLMVWGFTSDNKFSPSFFFNF